MQTGSIISTSDIEERLRPEVETALKFSDQPREWWENSVKMEAEMYRIDAYTKGHGGAVAQAIHDIYLDMPRTVDSGKFAAAIEGIADELPSIESASSATLDQSDTPTGTIGV